MTTAAFYNRDANHIPITNLGLSVSKAITFTGAAGAGAQGTIPLFTVTGTVQLYFFGVCNTDLVGASATLSAGVSGVETGLVGSTTATNIDSGTVWGDSSPAAVDPMPTSKIIGAGQDIILTVGTADITAGAMTYYCLWTPISEDGNIV